MVTDTMKGCGLVTYQSSRGHYGCTVLMDHVIMQALQHDVGHTQQCVLLQVIERVWTQVLVLQ